MRYITKLKRNNITRITTVFDRHLFRFNLEWLVMNWEYFDYAFAGSAMHIAYHISSQNKNLLNFENNLKHLYVKQFLN